MSNLISDFTGQNLYVGLDVHKKSWSVSILGDYNTFKRFTIEPSAEKLYKHLSKNFPGGNYFAAYEAGFCGFHYCRKLNKLGIETIVVNPADVPTKDKEKKFKNDPKDSHKIARSLRAKELEGIYVPDEDLLNLRSLLRCRNKLVADQTRSKNRIKGLLYYFGIEIPEEFDNARWSKAFIQFLDEQAKNHSTLKIIIEDFKQKASLVNLSTQELKGTVKKSIYHKQVSLLQTIPGIGELSAINFVLEIGDIKRFDNNDKLNCFVGLIPNMRASGEKSYVGNITNRGSKKLKSHLIESSWVAIGKDPELMACFSVLCNRMTKSRAIIRIAKKLTARIKAVLITEQPYKLNYNL